MAPDCGFYGEQRPCLTYAASGPERLSTLTRRSTGPTPTGRRRGLTPPSAPSERIAPARAHEEIYAEVLKRRLACTS